MKALRQVYDTWWVPEKKEKTKKSTVGAMWSSLKSMVSAKSAAQMDRDMLIHRTSEMIQLWADLTMMYQGDFMVLAQLYRDLRQLHVPFPSTRDKRYFDDLRQM